MWTKIRGTIASELSDLHDAAGVTRVVMRLLIAAILGGVLGHERERKHKSAGMRTHILVSVGAAMYVLVPQQSGATIGEMTRVIQGMVAGIGFLGAGAIIKAQENQRTSEVHGLTTAAGIWMTAAIGMSAGLGREMTAILSTLLAWVVLALLSKRLFGSTEPPTDIDGSLR